MLKIFETLLSRFTSITVYALVGRSGTGKSYHAKAVANKYNIKLIIDDGLLIKGEKIVAGHSAKQDKNFLQAVKTAVFDDEEHRNEVISALQRENFRRILIIGTSEKMVNKITSRLSLPLPEKIIHIEDVASEEDIENAMHIRFTEGKHVIPVPSIEITRSSPQIVFDSIKIRFKKKGSPKPILSEKTIVKPEFSKPDKETMSEVTLTQMVKHALSEYDPLLRVKKVKGIRNSDDSYTITVVVLLSNRHYIQGSISDLQNFIRDCLEKFGNIQVKSTSVEIEELQ